MAESGNFPDHFLSIALLVSAVVLSFHSLFSLLGNVLVLSGLFASALVAGWLTRDRPDVRGGSTWVFALSALATFLVATFLFGGSLYASDAFTAAAWALSLVVGYAAAFLGGYRWFRTQFAYGPREDAPSREA